VVRDQLHKWVSVGVDLAGTPKRQTGVSRMTGDLYCEACTVKEDEEIIKYVGESCPEVVAIDAPLSLPKNNQALRECERKLMKIGIRIFPPTFSGMRLLTERAIKLRERLEALGYRVIEVYPGGAQDFLGIPRKNMGLSLLREGLLKIGVKGLRGNETGDELDAVTCSFIGVLFLRRTYVEVGDTHEGVIIMPVAPNRLDAYFQKSP
jgi:predicted nuclease with RNAse H fold